MTKTAPVYAPAKFTGEWFPEGASPLSGYTNGETTGGGWETPVFTREVLEEAIASGLIGDAMFGSSRCFYDGTRDAFVLITALDGEQLPDNLDTATLLAKADGGDEEVQLGGRDYRVEIGTGFDINAGDRAAHVYQAGNDLIWSLAEA